YRLLDVVPIARDVLIENMSDGVIVLDAHNRIVDVNPVARGVIASAGRSPIGEPAADILSRWPETVAKFHDVSEVHTEVTVGDAPHRHLDLRITSLFDRRRLFAGRLIVWRDIT